MIQLDEHALISNEEDCVERLARFFPESNSVRIPIQVTALRGGSTRLREATVMQFAGMEHSLFISTLPLEFADKVRLEGRRKTDLADATVVGVQYHDGRKAVAVKFLRGPCTWVTQR